MEQLDIQQGSDAWHAHRATHFNASDAPIMMGCSPYKSRTQLLDELVTGIAPEVDAATQRRFDDGHRFEDLARPLAEKIIGRKLYPVTGSDGMYSASFDGLTADDSVAFEHKSLNDGLRAVLTTDGMADADFLPLTYRVQMEQQCMVSGCSRVLFMASKWNGSNELVEERHCWYEPDQELRAQIIAGWAQFEADLKTHQPSIAAEKPKAEAIIALPSVFVQATGMVTASNLTEFKEAATEFIAKIKTELVTDEDFANAEATVKFCKDAESNLESTKESVLAQMSTVDEVVRTLDHISAQLRDKRLMLDKLVKSEKESRKMAIVIKARETFAAHVAALEEEIKPIRLAVVNPDFGQAIKGLKSLKSMQEAVDNTLRDGKAAADAQAKDYRAKLDWCKKNAEGQFHLFPDLQQIITKPMDDFTLLITSRINEAKAKEEKRIEEERARIAEEERIKAEAKAKADAEAKAKEEKDQANPPASTETAALQQPVHVAEDVGTGDKSVELVYSEGYSFEIIEEKGKQPTVAEIVRAVIAAFGVDNKTACDLIVGAAHSIEQQSEVKS